MKYDKGYVVQYLMGITGENNENDTCQLFQKMSDNTVAKRMQ